MMPFAPGRLSTTTCWPHFCDRSSATSRTTTSSPPPAACGTTTSTPTPGSGASGSVAYAIGADPTTLDPQITDDGNERAVNDNVYETLVWRNGKTSALEPLLATSWELKGDTTWEFKLRPNVKFTNGAAMNADAVVASVKRIIDPALKSPQFSYLNSITDAKKIDDLTVEIITNSPDPALPSRIRAARRPRTPW